MELAKEQRCKVSDILNMSEGQRAELLDGVLYDMASPSRSHQRLVAELMRKIADYIDRNGGNCEVYIAPFAVCIYDDDYNYVEPDIFVVCDRKKMDELGCHGAPDWIIEVVSPSTQRMDYELKLLKYRTAGVREYWIVDPKTKTVFVHYFERNEMETYGFSDRIPAGIYRDTAEGETRLEIDFLEIAGKIGL